MTDVENYGKFTRQHLVNIRKGVELFNEQKYWECHEDLEHYWLEDVGDKARFIYWAVIQVAACMIHYRDDNLAGARGMISKAKNKLQRAEENNVETDLLDRYLSWEKLKSLVREVPSEPELKDFQKLFEFRFPDPETWKDL